ncbi:hypothetical protein OEZ85_005787 [Tetradesmus obliquus]|uniref:Uncharacterized protein n=1 Tax=Tetradesmus obliquus TaxID=3088 RepID=A0ABY8UF42_TETOB|nr:hypothetical protein OEZ85_005787 [Tetradesmus obliquus]
MYTSPFLRCIQTAQHVVRALKDEQLVGFQEEVQLREQDWGNFQAPGQQTRNYEERLKYGRFFFRFPEGESAADVYDRMTMFQDHFVRDIAYKRFAGGTSVMMVTHGLALRLFLMRWLHWTVDEFLQVHNPPTAAPVVLVRECPQLPNPGNPGICVPAEAIKACYRLSHNSLAVLRGVTEGMGSGKGISSKQQLLDWRPYQVQVPPPPKMDPAVEAKVHELMNIGYGAGHIPVLQWLRTQRPQCPWDFTACTAAAGTPGNLQTLVWLRQQQPRCPWAGTEVWEAAAASGCFETLRWLQVQRCPGFDSPSICAAAAGAGQVAVLQWLQQQRPPCTYDESAVAAAVAGGHISVLQWLREVEGPHSLLLLRTSSADCTAAAAGGHLQVLHFLREVLDPPCPFSTATAVAAASGGHLVILQYLAMQQQQQLQQQHGCSCWSPAVCAAAAAGGHQHVLQWLRDELDPPCPWDHSTCRSAAAAGNLPLLHWLQAQQQPCPLHASVALAAAESCHLQVLQWLIEEAGCPYDADALWHVAFTRAAAAGIAAAAESDSQAAESWRELYCYIERLRQQQ